MYYDAVPLVPIVSSTSLIQLTFARTIRFNNLIQRYKYASGPAQGTGNHGVCCKFSRVRDLIDSIDVYSHYVNPLAWASAGG